MRVGFRHAPDSAIYSKDGKQKPAKSIRLFFEANFLQKCFESRIATQRVEPVTNIFVEQPLVPALVVQSNPADRVINLERKCGLDLSTSAAQQ